MKRLWIILILVLAASNAAAQVRLPTPDEGGQREPTIALDALERIFIAYIDVNQNALHLARSVNGGSTWEDRLPAGLPGVDPSLSVDAHDRLYLAWLNDTIHIFRSDDHGQTIAVRIDENGNPVQIRNDALSLQHADRPWIITGSSATSADVVYLTYAGYTFPMTGCSPSDYKSDIYFRKSVNDNLDRNDAWTAPVMLTANLAANNYRCTSAPMALGPNGVLYILINCLLAQVNPNCQNEEPFVLEHHVYLLRSDNRGDTWALATEVPNINPVIPYATTGYASFSMVNRRTNWATIATLPNGVVGIAWPCDSSTDIDICFQYSANGGTTFSAPITVNNDAAPAYHFFPAMTGDQNGFHIIWMDSRATGLDTASPRWAAYRSDGGAVWSPSTMVSLVAASGNDDNSSPQGFGDFFDITSRNNEVFSTWSDSSSGTADVYAGR